MGNVEVVNTNTYELLDSGNYTFAVEEVKKLEKNGNVFYKFTLSYVKNGQREVWTTLLFRSNMSDILRYSGMSETTPGYFSLDYDAIIGKMFSCTVVHEQDKKGVMREKITNVQPASINPGGAKTAAEIKWDEA